MGTRVMALQLLVLLTMVFIPTSSSAEALISIEPDSTRVWVNSQFFQLDIMVNSEVDSLMGYDMTVIFDPVHLQVQDVSEGALPLNSGYPTFFRWLNEYEESDSVWVNGSILGNTIAGPGQLFRITFWAIYPGITTVGIVRSDMRNDENQKLPHLCRSGTVFVYPTIGVEPAKGTWGRIKCLFR